MKKPGSLRKKIDNLFEEIGPKSRAANQVRYPIFGRMKRPLGGFYSTVPVENLPGLSPKESVVKVPRKKMREYKREMRRG